MGDAKMWKQALLTLVFLFSAIATHSSAQPAAAGQQPQASAAADTRAPIDSGYMLGPGDVVEVSLVGRADFGGRARVATDGTILLNMVGRIKAENRTVLELSDDIRAALIKGGFYSDPVVRVEAIGISSRYVTVLGAFGSPGLLPLDRAYRLSEILARVGGGGSAGTDYIVLTREGTQQRYSIAKLAAGGPEDDPVVQSGDKLYLPPAETIAFYISGEVKSPGSYSVTEGLTVRMAIAKGGGVTENGSEKKVKIIRKGQPVKGVKLEDLIEVGDIVTIGERMF